MDIDSALNILKMSSPVVMGMLGKQIHQNNASSSIDISNIIENLMDNSESTQQESSVIEKLLDSDGDGSIVHDLFNLGKGFFK